MSADLPQPPVAKPGPGTAPALVPQGPTTVERPGAADGALHPLGRDPLARVPNEARPQDPARRQDVARAVPGIGVPAPSSSGRARAVFLILFGIAVIGSIITAASVPPIR